MKQGFPIKGGIIPICVFTWLDGGFKHFFETLGEMIQVDVRIFFNQLATVASYMWIITSHYKDQYSVIE